MMLATARAFKQWKTEWCWAILRIGPTWSIWKDREKFGEGRRDEVLALVPDMHFQSAVTAIGGTLA